MKTKSNGKNEILEGMKSSIEGLGLQVLEEKDGEEVSRVLSEVDLDAFKMDVNAVFFKKQDIVAIENRLPKIYDVLNRINRELMDIGTFSVCPPAGLILLRAAIPVPGKCLNEDQLQQSLMRLLWQGDKLYGLIARVDLGDLSPEEIVDDFIKKAKELLSKKEMITDNIDSKYVH